MFNKIDSHALNAPMHLKLSPSKLAKYLAAGANSDIEKARAIFRWITEYISYDVDEAEKWPSISGLRRVHDTLTSKSGICQDYADLYCMMTNFIGIPSVTISGKTKKHRSDDILPENEPGHAWNATKINGQWYLSDATWGAGFVNNKGDFCRRFNDFYFFPSPEKLLTSHFPSDSQWQLVGAKITYKDFCSRIMLQSKAFHYNVFPLSRNMAHFATTSPAAFVIQADTFTKIAVEISFGKKELFTEFYSDINSIFTNRYIFFSRINETTLGIKVIFPIIGKFRVSFFAAAHGENKYDCVFSYDITVH